MIRLNLLALFGLALMILLPMKSDAESYKYVDEKGAVHYTNLLSAVPKKYWDKMEIIDDEKKPPPQSDTEEEASPKGSETSAANVEQREAATSSKPAFRLDAGTKERGKIIIAYIAAFLFLFVLSKRYLKKRQVNIILFLLLSGILVVYLMRTYVTETHKTYNQLKEETKKIEEKMGKRSKERAKIMNEMSEIMNEGENKEEKR